VSIQLYIYVEARSPDGGWKPVRSGHIGNPDVRGLQALFVGRELGYSTDPPVEQVPSQFGLPVDLSPEFRDLAEGTLRDHMDWVGWITLDDLLAYDWDQQVRVTQRVNAEYEDWFGDGDQPFPPELEHEPIFSPIIVEPDGPAMRTRQVPVSWTETPRDLAGEQFIRAVEEMAASTDDPSRIRLVFWTG
jgi:hypothetical protein